jgi:hypothetical protein
MRKIYLILSLAFLFLLGCENHLEMTLPEGPQGEQGPQGEDGLSAFDLWKIFYQKGPNATFEDFMNSLRGKDGKDGAVPIIGANGNWYINGVDTNIPAEGKDGKDGKDGVTPEIGSNGNWWIGGKDTGIRAEGRDGYTPKIGYNGNWWINGSDTGFPAIGKDGKDGVDGITPQIGYNGNWWIDGQDTGVPVTGKDGKPGIDGITPTIGSNGNWYIDDCDTGVPARGQDGKDGKDGITPNIGANGNWYIDGDDTGVPAKGVDGVTPQIGGNGNWYINGQDTGVPARGKDGKDGVDGVTPHIGGNGNWYINGQDTGVPAKGITPIIGGNGNWYIDGRDTGVPARGKDGVDGVTPHIGGNGNWYVGSYDTGVPAKGVTPFVGGNGNWYIDGVDTGVPATGADGIDGATPQIGESGNWVIDGCDTGIPAVGKDGKDGVCCEITIGYNGNWWIDGEDTGKKAVGEDGKDGVTPEIVIGWNGNWFINGVDTGVRAVGKDGKDGLDGIDGVSPTVGSNGNWYIGDFDTGVPAKGADGIDGHTPEIGSNGNWWINGEDSGIPAQGKDGSDGKDGVDGKTSYELWKEAVDAGDMTNKDGSQYTGGNSWEAFLKWLQGGDVSVLHQYWLSQGNTGDLQAFIEALFDCHCDGVTIIVFAPNDCLNLDIDNNIAAIPNATLTVGTEPGAKVQITGNGVTTQDKTVAAGDSEVKFTIPRTAEDQFVLITVTLPGGETSDQITKSARIPALKFIELESATIVKVEGEEKDIATITFKEEPIELYINGTLVYDPVNGVKNNWEVSADKKTFTKTYTRAASPYPITVKGIGDDNGCSIFTNLLEVPQLTPVEINGDIEVAVGECDATLTLKGTKGMTVTAKTSFNNETLVMDEGPEGVYTVKVPRRFTQYTVAVSAAKAGAGTVNKTVQIKDQALLPTPFTYEFTTANSLDPVVKGTFTNPNSKNIEITFSRNLRNTGSGNPRLPWTDGANDVNDTKTVTVPANGSVTLEFLKNVADDFSTGRYTLYFETTSFCGLPYKNNYSVQNQTDFSHGFRKVGEEGGDDGSGYPGGGGSNPYDPDYDVPTLNPGEESTHTIFEVWITDAIPNSYAQFLLNTKDGFRSIWGGSKKVDENGHIRILVKMHNDDVAIANGGIGEIKLSKAKTSTEFFHTKKLVNVQLPV